MVFGVLNNFNKELRRSQVALVSQRKSRRERLWGKISWSTDVRTVFYDEYDNLEKGRKGERKHRHEEVGLGTADSE